MIPLPLLVSYPGFTIAQYIVMPYYDLDDFWKENLHKLIKDYDRSATFTTSRFIETKTKNIFSFNDFDDRLEYIYINHPNKLKPEKILNMKYSKFSKTCKNILIENFIDDEIGNVQLYKSKKRLELRLCKDIINNCYSIKLY